MKDRATIARKSVAFRLRLWADYVVKEWPAALADCGVSPDAKLDFGPHDLAQHFLKRAAELERGA